MTEEGALPEGWAPYTLGSLLEPGGLFDGPFGSNLKTTDYTESGVRVVRLENLSNLRFNEEKRTYISREKYGSLKKHTVRTGDLLVGSFLDAEVRVAMVPELPTPAIAKADCFCIRTRRDLVDSRFLMYRLGATETKDALIEEIHGATRPRVTTRQLRGLRIGLPLVSEQVRIVARIEAALASVTGVGERLSNVNTGLRRLRQVVLAAACDGRLTADWRRGDEGSLDLAASRDDDSEKALPVGWRTSLVRDLAEIKGGIQKQPKRAPKKNAFPYLRVANVLRGRVVLDRLERMELFADELETYRLLKDDLLIVEGNGSPSEIGRSALWTGEVRDCVHQNHIIRVRAHSCNPRYLNLYWNSPQGIGRISQEAVTTTGLLSLSTKKVGELEVPLPPDDEQHEIVRRIEALFGLADAIEKRVAAASARADKLTQAILAKAFRGELVPTEAELNRRREASAATPPPAVRSAAARPTPRRSR